MNASFEENLMQDSVRKKTFSCCQYFHDILFQKLEKSKKVLSNLRVKTPQISVKEEKNSNASTFLSENPKNQIIHEKINENPLSFFNNFSNTEHPIEKYPINQLLCWDFIGKKRQILVKITEKRFKYKKEINKISSEIRKKRSFEPKIKDFIGIPSDYKHKMPIFEVIQHLASRLKGLFLLDFSNGIGEYTIPLIKTSEFVVSFFRNPLNCGFTNENLNKSQISSGNLTYFSEEEFDFHGKFDVFFINPYTVFNDFCSKNLNSEETKRFLRKFRLKAQGFAMILNRNTQNIENLIELLSFLSQKQQKCSWEIEKIYYNEKLKFLYVYQGDIAAISLEEELDFIKRKFFENPQEIKQEFHMDYALKVNNLMYFLNKTVGNNTILHFIQNSIEKSQVNSSGNLVNIYEIFKKILRKSPFFKKSGSFLANRHKSSIRVIKPSLFVNASPLQFNSNFEDSCLEESSFPSEKSLNKDEDINLGENLRESEEEYDLSDYSVNFSNEESKDMGNPGEIDEENEEFEIIQMTSETKLPKSKRMSVSEGNEEKKTLPTKKSFGDDPAMIISEY